MKDQDDAQLAKSRPFDRLRLVWHDYPGEWFEEEPSGEEEANRRVDTFRSLLRSDVAVVLVDGQKLLDHAGQEEQYLKSVFWGLRDGILRLKDDLLDSGKLLDRFPRIWIVALSKADLHPELDVHAFEDLVVEKTAGDMASLHEVVKGMVQLPEALSIGEDFMLLSSAKFEPGKIEVTERVGVDLLLPVACLLPMQRIVQWSERFEIPRRMLEKLANNTEELASVLIGAQGLALFVSKAAKANAFLAKAVPIIVAVGLPMLTEAVKLSEAKIKEMSTQARNNRDLLTATLTQFQLQLDQGVEDRLLVKSRR